MIKVLHNFQKIFGGHGAGFDDGSKIGHPKFHSPQGLVFKDKNTLFVADTENHAIRKVFMIVCSKYVDKNKHLNCIIKLC